MRIESDTASVRLPTGTRCLRQRNQIAHFIEGVSGFTTKAFWFLAVLRRHGINEWPVNGSVFESAGLNRRTRIYLSLVERGGIRRHLHGMAGATYKYMDLLNGHGRWHPRSFHVFLYDD